MTGFGDFKNLKFPLILATSVFINSLNFMLSRVEHDKIFVTWGQIFFLLSKLSKQDKRKLRRCPCNREIMWICYVKTRHVNLFLAYLI